MVRIFVESKHDKTTETVFLKTLLKSMNIDNSEYEIMHVNGKDNLHNNEVAFKENTLTGGKNIIVFDADTITTGAGYENSKKRIMNTFGDDVKIDGIFLFPNNHDDGIFENLLEHLMRKDYHRRFIDCFDDYEKCLGNDYLTPDLKGRLHTYMSAQKSLSNTQRSKLGSGEWLFDNPHFWNLNDDYIRPLKEFISSWF